MHRLRSLALALATASLSGSALTAQDNAVHGIDVSLGILSNLTNVGHSGPLGTGISALAMSTTSCNMGSKTVPWEAPMDADHPFIAFLIARELDGRMEQISDLSHVKHGFFALANSQCIPCQGGSPSGDFLGIGCSDTYGIQNNADNFWLAPQQEINPWLGTWDPVCSFFDQGLNPQPGTMCDGNRSFSGPQSNSLGPLGNRVLVQDADLNPNEGANFFYASHYVIKSEPEAQRQNNIGFRPFMVQVQGGSLSFLNNGPLVNDTVLQAWTDASISSAKNGVNADGRFYVGVVVTGPEDGMYHYEYAVHNRDNARGGGGLRIPICSGATVANDFFKDVDADPGTDWSFDGSGAELHWSNNGEPLRWNSIYNFAFDSDAAPVAGTIQIDQFAPGAGLSSVAVATTVPGGLFNANTGPGCSNGAPPSLYATGSPAQATLGNQSFGVESGGNDAGALAVLLLGASPGTTPLGGDCNLYMGGNFGSQILLFSSTVADADGDASFGLPVPNNASLQGAELYLQVASQRFAGGPYLSSFDISNGLSVRVGDSLPGCP